MGGKKIQFTGIHGIVRVIMGRKKKGQRIPESSKWDDDKISTIKKSDVLLRKVSTQMSLLKKL